ncbi:hypothetical protein PG987_013423 [Apiospora arundinis]
MTVRHATPDHKSGAEYAMDLLRRLGLYMVREIVRLAWGLGKEGVDQYLERIPSSLATLTATASQAP